MNILVTGGLGYIGSHTCIELLNHGYTPIIIDNLSNSKISVTTRIESLTGHSPVFYEGDIRDDQLLNKIFETHDISAVIHFAGLKAVGESVKQPLAYYDTNVSGSLILARVMQQYNVKHIIFSSSATVYGEDAPTPYVETLPTGRPTSPYGWSKLMTEQCLMDTQTANPDWNVTLLRYFNPVGAHPSGLLGEDPQGIPNNLMPFISQVAVGKREFLSIFGHDYPTTDGTCVRDYIHVVDLAKGHVKALEAKLNQTGTFIYNLGSGNGYSVLEVVNAFSKVCGHEVAYRFAPRRDGDLPAFWADPQKAAEELGWQTSYSLEDMVADSWNWQTKNPDGYPD